MTHAARTTRNLKALVVEDSPPMRKMMVSALSRVRGLFVVEARDGVEALRLLAAKRFDLILTDINMPIIDGLKLVKQIRSNESHRDTPVVVITTEGALEDRERAMQLGANAYVTKPIQAEQVISLVRDILDFE